MKNTATRRSFLKASLIAATAPTIIPASALGLSGNVAPSERITIGIFGLGTRGSLHSRIFMGKPGVQIVSVCDAYLSKAKRIAATLNKGYGDQYGKDNYKAIDTYQDFREICARPDIDAVCIASPENWHALMSIEAMKKSKDVFCEKALTLTVEEGRQVCNTAERYGKVFQAGTQQRSMGKFKYACELARNGYLGKLKQIRVGVPGSRQIEELPVAPVPEDLNYDIWLGPARYTPHRSNMCSYNWYFMTDYCAGWIQSWGVHHCDIALWAAPSLHESTLEIDGTAEFPTAGSGDTSMKWKTKMITPDGLEFSFCDNTQPDHPQGCTIVGEKGWVHVNRRGIRAEPASLLKTKLKTNDEHLYNSTDHHENFINCIKTRKETVAPAEACHRATTITLIADIATRLGRKVKWDWKEERFINDDVANRMLSRSMRTPWRM